MKKGEGFPEFINVSSPIIRYLTHVISTYAEEFKFFPSAFAGGKKKNISCIKKNNAIFVVFEEIFITCTSLAIAKAKFKYFY
ncbi:MAG: hypothetical protein J7K46_10385 [Bacteroidales bacterium]|nr:hypothetical protein [Bacteroidales bacterium]